MEDNLDYADHLPEYYKNTKEIQKNEFWEGIVVIHRDPGKRIIRVRMLNIYWYDSHYHDLYPAVLDLPYDQFDWLYETTEEDLKKLQPYELNTMCNYHGIEGFNP